MRSWTNGWGRWRRLSGGWRSFTRRGNTTKASDDFLARTACMVRENTGIGNSDRANDGDFDSVLAREILY